MYIVRITKITSIGLDGVMSPKPTLNLIYIKDYTYTLKIQIILLTVIIMVEAQ